MMMNALLDSNRKGECQGHRPPRIVIPYVTDINQFWEFMDEEIGENNYKTKVTKRNHLLLQCANNEAYRRTVKLLMEKHVLFHHYQLREDKPFRFAMRTIHFSTEKLHIINELGKLNHVVLNIYQPKKKHFDEKHNIFFIDLAKAANNIEVFKITYLCRQEIKCEPIRKSKELAQCHRCQEFGHTKHYCNKEFICVKCAGEHASTDCKMSADMPPTCANCNANHPANYKGCSVYLRALARRQKTFKTVINAQKLAKKEKNSQAELGKSIKLTVCCDEKEQDKPPTTQQVVNNNHSNNYLIKIIDKLDENYKSQQRELDDILQRFDDMFAMVVDLVKDTQP